MSAFTQAFAILIGHEGGYSVTPADAGDWTGGQVGSGQCLGTNWGIDTASYPDGLKALPPAVRATMPALVRDITQTQALAYYKPVYWDAVSADALPPEVALLVFDAAVNNGAGRAARWLQEAVGAYQDGDIGPETLAAIAKTLAANGPTALAAEFHAQRINFMAQLATWKTFGLGWSRRLAMLPFQAATITAA